ncbi:MAG: hypothetical protein ACT4QC_06415 [Planctomycetaceae bacterium]
MTNPDAAALLQKCKDWFRSNPKARRRWIWEMFKLDSPFEFTAPPAQWPAVVQVFMLQTETMADEVTTVLSAMLDDESRWLSAFLPDMATRYLEAAKDLRDYQPTREWIDRLRANPKLVEALCFDWITHVTAYWIAVCRSEGDAEGASLAKLSAHTDLLCLWCDDVRIDPAPLTDLIDFLEPVCSYAEDAEQEYGNRLRQAFSTIRRVVHCARLSAPGANRPMTASGVPPAPMKLLTSWREILAVLGMDVSKENRTKVKRLNERFGGPIPKPAQGGQPIVDKAALIDWWNKLQILQQDLENQREGAILTAQDQFAFGRSATIVPELGGQVKKRRTRHRKT